MLKDLLSKRTLTSALLSLLLILASTYSWFAIPVEVMPKDGVPPFLLVRVNTATPQDPRFVEIGVGSAVEGALKTVSRTTSLDSSIDSSGISTSIRFKPKTNLDLATIQITEALAPLDEAGLIDINSVSIIRLNPEAIAIMKISVSNPEGKKLNLNALKEEIRIQFESVKGVAKTEIIAMENPIYELKINSDLLRRNGLSASRFVEFARLQNFSERVGAIYSDLQIVPVSIKNEDISYDYLLDHPLRFDFPSSLASLSNLKIYSKHQSEVVRFNGNDTYFFEIYPKDNANLLNLDKDIHLALAKVTEGSLGHDLKFETVFNQTDELKGAIDDVFSSLLQAMAITFFIVFLFYRKLNQTLIVNLSIPLTLLVTVLLMYLGKTTLNILSLSGLILGIGMVVDNAVLVIDRIDELNSKKKTKKRDAKNIGQAAADVSLALVLSSLTNALIFLPVAFIEGNDGFIDLLRAFQLPIIGSLVASLIVSLLVLPLIKLAWKGPEAAKVEDERNSFSLGMMKKIYRWRNFLSIGCIFLFLFMLDRVSEMNSSDIDLPRDPYINLFVKFTGDLKPEEKRKHFIEWESLLLEAKESLKFKFVISEFDPQNHNGILTFYPIVTDDLDKDLDQLQTRLKTFVNTKKNQIGVRVDVGQLEFQLTSGKAKLDFLIEAASQNSGEKLIGEISKFLEKEPGFSHALLEKDDRAEKEIILVPTPGAFEKSGVSVNQIQQSVSPYLSVLNFGSFSKNGGPIDVRAAIVPAQGGWSLDEVLALPLPLQVGSVRIGELVNPVIQNGYRGIQRRGGKSQIRLSVFLDAPSDKIQEVKTSLSKKMGSFNFPLGMGFARDDSAQRVAEMKKKTNFVVLLSVFLIYLVLAAIFESLFLPLAVVFSIPLALVFGAGGLWLLGESLDVMARLGLVILVGVGVNNAIMLIDMITGLRNEGLPRKEAILLGCAKRMRAVLMTTAIQVISVLPVALGKSKLMGIPYSSLGVVIISGMIFSTIITIVVLPVLYELCDNIDMKLKNN